MPPGLPVPQSSDPQLHKMCAPVKECSQLNHIFQEQNFNIHCNRLYQAGGCKATSLFCINIVKSKGITSHVKMNKYNKSVCIYLDVYLFIVKTAKYICNTTEQLFLD